MFIIAMLIQYFIFTYLKWKCNIFRYSLIAACIICIFFKSDRSYEFCGIKVFT